MVENKIGVDFGGSFIRAGLFKNRKLIRKYKRNTEVNKGKKKIIKNIIESIEKVKGADKIKAIGIGSPGPVDYKTGKILNPPNIKPLWGVNLKKIIENKFKVKVRVENDANCAALAEAKIRNVKNLIFLTLGTGLGSGIILNGKIYRGEGFASEIGHHSIDFNGHKCKCGNYGCLEAYVGSVSIVRIAKAKNLRTDPYEIQERALKSERKYKEIFKEIGKYLGIGLANIANILDPELITIGGGMGKIGNLILKPAKKEMKKRLFVKGKTLKIERSRLSEDASLIGASFLI